MACTIVPHAPCQVCVVLRIAPRALWMLSKQASNSAAFPALAFSCLMPGLRLRCRLPQNPMSSGMPLKVEWSFDLSFLDMRFTSVSHHTCFQMESLDIFLTLGSCLCWKTFLSYRKAMMNNDRQVVGGSHRHQWHRTLNAPSKSFNDGLDRFYIAQYLCSPSPHSHETLISWQNFVNAET